MLYPRSVKVCLYRSVSAPVPQPAEFPDFPAFAAWLGANYVEGSKTDAPLWAPHTLAQGATRANESVETVTACVLDLDDTPALDLSRVLGPALERAGLAFSVHTTHKHWIASPLGKVRARVVIPYSRPVEPREWRGLQLKIAGMLGVAIQKNKRGGLDVGSYSRPYYFWSGPPGARHAAFFHVGVGVPLDVESLLRGDRGALMRPRATVHTLTALASKLERSNRSDRKPYGEALALIAKGEAFTLKVGDRDDTVWWLAGFLSRELTGSDEPELCEVFRASVDAMQYQEGALTMAVVQDKVARVCQDREAPSDGGGSEVRERWRACLERSGRTQAYAPDELEAIAESIALPRDRLSSAWVLQRGQGYWALSEHGYLGPYSQSEIAELAEVVLAPADSDGVQVTIASKNGTTRKRPADLVAHHGRVLSEVVRDLALQSPYVSETVRGSTLYLAPCPIRAIEPRRVPEVERWLALLGGESAPALLDWIARVAWLSEPSPALWLEGASGAGKSLLAVGLARLWTEEHPTDLGDALARFNADVERCPLVFGDEKLPTDYKGNPLVHELKKLISSTSRRYEQKRENLSTVRGCVRVMLATNNARELFSVGNELTPDDIEALLERILHVHVTRAPAEYLTALGGFEAIGEKWLETDAIAAHALYLRDTRTVKRGRFAIQAAPNSRIRGLATSSGLRAAICHWLVLWLTTTRAGASGLIAIHGGRLEVSARGLHELWSEIEVSWGRTPSVSRIADTLRAVTLEYIEREVQGYTVRFSAVDTEALADWAEDKGFATRADLDKRLAQAPAVHTAQVYPIGGSKPAGASGP